MKGDRCRSELFGDPPDLHVVGDHHHHLVPGFEKRVAGHEVGLGRAVGHQHIVRALIRIERRDALPELDGAVGLPVAQNRLLQIHQLVRAEKLSQRVRVESALGQVVFNGVFVERLHPLELEDRELHEDPSNTPLAIMRSCTATPVRSQTVIC